MPSIRGRVHDALMRARGRFRSPVLRTLDRACLRGAALAQPHLRRLLLDQSDPPFMRILTTRPHEVNVASATELHMLLCERDVLRALWALKSFYHFAGLDARLVVHDDGTLSPDSLAVLRAHFVGCEIPERPRERARELLAAYPMCRFFRDKHPIAGKLLDVLLFARGRYLVVMDSDLLWFRASPEVSACVAAARPFHLVSGREAYARNRRFMEEELGLRPAANVNAGLVGYSRADFSDFDFLESALDRLVNVPVERLPASLGFEHDAPLPGYDPDDPVESIVWWVMEQTLYALLLARGAGAMGLPRRASGTGTGHQFAIEAIAPDTALQHFISDARWNAFFPVGVHHLLREGFLDSWERGRRPS